MARSLTLPLHARGAGVAAALALLGCAAELPTTTERTIEGRYELQTVAGQALPFTRTVEDRVEVLHGGFMEFEVASFRSEFRYTYEQDGVMESETVTGSGVWLQYDDQIQLAFIGFAQPVVARVDEDEISLRSDGIADSRTSVAESWMLVLRK